MKVSTGVSVAMPILAFPSDAEIAKVHRKNELFCASLGFGKAGSEFMSAVCNRRIRSSIKAAG